MRAVERNPIYVAVFLAVLVLPQARACTRQVTEAGFRPFTHAPERVAFSWDMFSVPITRCTIDIDPPAHFGSTEVRSMHGTGLPLEWDPVYDTAGDYALAAHEACTFAPTTATALVRCFYQDGHTTRDAISCR
jgi:hypothetical protein